MTHTAKHTPTGEVMAHFNLSDEEWDGLPSFMQQKLATVYCQHAAAPAMYEALVRFAKAIKAECYDEDILVDIYHDVRDVLAQAEGRQA